MNTIRAAVAQRQPTQVTSEGGVLALRDEDTWWSPRQIAALKALGIKNASEEDLLVFFHYCQKTKLDPFSKQIYLLERRAKVNGQWICTQTIQIGIDGFRVQAQRAATREGVQLEYEDTVWFDAKGGEHKVWLEAGTPAGARVAVIKHLPDGRRIRIPGVAKFESYAAYGTDKDTGQKYLQSQWGVMPDHMIEKCAEAFALRRAFPNDLSGQYLEEELQHEQPPKLAPYAREPQGDDDGVLKGSVEPGETEPPAPEPAEAEADRKAAFARIAAIFRQHGLSSKTHAAARRAILTGLLVGEAATGYLDVDDLTPAVAEHLADQLKQLVEGMQPADGEVAAQLARYAELVTEQVAAADQGSAKE